MAQGVFPQRLFLLRAFSILCENTTVRGGFAQPLLWFGVFPQRLSVQIGLEDGLAG